MRVKGDNEAGGDKELENTGGKERQGIGDRNE